MTFRERLSAWMRSWWPFQPSAQDGDTDPALTDTDAFLAWQAYMSDLSASNTPLPAGVTKQHLAQAVTAVDAYLDTRLAEFDAAESGQTLDEWITANRTAIRQALPAEARVMGRDLLKQAARRVRQARREAAGRG